MHNLISEEEVEKYILELLLKLGYEVKFGPDISPDGLHSERRKYTQVVLDERLFNSLRNINTDIKESELEEVHKKLVRDESQDLTVNNKNFHKYITDGVDIETRDSSNRIVGKKIWLIDRINPGNNDFLAVNQFTVIEKDRKRRLDIVIFINGIPLIFFELKNPLEENTDIKYAYNQLQTYKNELPTLFKYNEVLAISDGYFAKAGTISSEYERFMPWKSKDGISLISSDSEQLQTLINGVLNKKTIIDLIPNFIVFENEEGKYTKKLAAYHQYFAVNRAVEKTIEASDIKGDGRGGVIWHTQGSGKSLTMVFYSGKLVLTLNNPTIVLLTDRNDLDDQLFGVFSRCSDLLRQTPVQAGSREELKELLSVASGGIIFTTIQKFFPDEKGAKYPRLSDRSNIIVIADEAHRSQYDFIDGYARHMRDALPNATFIGFTGTPLEREDRNTPEVFGDYIDIYDIERAIADGSTVSIYYESRLAKLKLNEDEVPKIDKKFEEVTEGEEEEEKKKLKSKWARLEAIVGSEKRIRQVAEDIVKHYEERQNTLDSKAMIVAMSRRICIDIYNEIIKLRPFWHNDDINSGTIKIIMTGSAKDPYDWQKHIYTKDKKRFLADRFKDPKDKFKIAIVRDMWLTGFDVPCLATMYIDKPMRGHNLMQAIARVNRVYKDKPGGLIVDYIGIGFDLKKAITDYTASGGKGKPVIDKEEAVAVLKEKYEVLKAIIHGYDYSNIFRTKDYKEKMKIIQGAIDFIVSDDDKKERFLKYSLELTKAYALSVPHPEALKLADEVAFFDAVKSRIKIITRPPLERQEDIENAVKQIVSEAITTNEVIDIFAAAGIKRPDVSILSDEFLFEIKNQKHKNLAIELLKRLINDEIKLKARKNLVKSREFSEMLEEAVKKYLNKTIESGQIIEELVKLAREIRESDKRGEELGLSEDELAFYDALETNDSAVKILGDKVLKDIARELVITVKKNITIDWNIRESIRALLRSKVKRVLRKYNYPPDKQEKATKTVIEQTEFLCQEWNGN
jgi:type I restriction enzyme, R subunit